MSHATALEQILYQNKDSFVDTAAELVQGVLTEIDAKGYKSDKDILEGSKKLTLLNILIKNRFGLNTEITRNRLFTGNIAAVYTPVSVQMVDYTYFDLMYVHNKELRAYIQKSTTMLLSEEAKKSVVNFKLAKISGYYSKIGVYINIDFYTLYKKIKLSAKEIVSVLLHEIGHVFVGFSYHYRVNQLNLNTAVVIDALNHNDVDKAVYLLNNSIKSKEDYLQLKTNTKVRHDIAFAVVAQYVDLSMEYRYFYSISNNESMADNFATRFNVGRELVSSLEKMNVYLYEEYGITNYFQGKGKQEIHSFDQLMEATVLSLVDVFGLVAQRLQMSIVEPILLLFSSSFYTYDNTYDRYKRIKIAIIHNLKTLSHDPKLQKELLSQLDYIDEQLKAYKAKSESGVITDLLLSLFIPKYKEGMRFKKLQNTIEEFLNSDLTYLTTKLEKT